MVIEEHTSQVPYYTVGGELKKTVPFTIELREWLTISHKIGLVFYNTLEQIRQLEVYQRGMVCGCFENLSIYQYDDINNDADDGVNVIQPHTVYIDQTGRWLLKATLANSAVAEDSLRLGGELPEHYLNLVRLISVLVEGTDISLDTTTIAGKIIVNYTGTGGGLQFADLVNIIQSGTNITLDIDVLNQTITINSDYTETDPIFEAWLATSPLSPFLTEETDPIFSAWLASNPTSGMNTGDQVADGVTITGTGTTADPFVAVGVETTLLNSNELKFDNLYQFGSIASPRTGDITLNFTDAKLGILLTMFHDDSEMPPEILSNSKFVILQGYYEPDSINRLTFEIVDITSGSEKILVTIIPTE